MHYISYTARKPVKKGKAEKMIKGINKQIIEIKCTNDEYFDKVLLFVRADKADTPQGLLKKNAETLKQGTIETATEAERGIIDIETLVQTNKSLIDTMNEVVRIQTEGRQKRAEAEKTLVRMESELKNRLING